MIKGMCECPETGLILPTKFIDEKQSLKKSINELVDNAVNDLSYVKENYFLTIHALFDQYDPSIFKFSQPKATEKIPKFMSNTLVYWVSNKRGICELLWMVPAKRPGEKLKPVFNTKGVAYLQAKDAMPKPS